MVNRRTFLKTGSVAGGMGLVSTINALPNRKQEATTRFGIHEFIENHPDAVFIMKTNVDTKTNHDAIKDTAHKFGQTVIVPKENGVPIATLVPIKPNLTNVGFNQTPKDLPQAEAVEYRMGIVTDPWFVEGVIESIKDIGVPADNIWSIETWHLGNWGPMGYDSMTERTGTHMNDTRETKVDDLPPEKVVWKDVPDGVYFEKIPYIWPFNADNTWQLNISKFKTHGMGVTLNCKNIQGTICHDSRGHCSRSSITNFEKSTAWTDIENNYNRHVAEGIPRWDRPGTSGGYWMET
ncbi:MAG: DUF362 domain-containing protein, partial [Candidatus Latescibacteria bacterium]|nr:DUF362 domain-containing protein [Candidatus Latescibacterota bacterium]